LGRAYKGCVKGALGVVDGERDGDTGPGGVIGGDAVPDGVADGDAPVEGVCVCDADMGVPPMVR
jgi:hypothetical protein